MRRLLYTGWLRLLSQLAHSTTAPVAADQNPFAPVGTTK